MKNYLSIFLATLCAVAAHGQTIKSIGYNTTNGQIIAANVVWTNSFSFSTNTVAAQVRTNLSLGWPALTNSNTATTLLGVNTNGQVVYSGTNVLTFTNNIEIGNEDEVGISGSYLSWNGNNTVGFEDNSLLGLWTASCLEITDYIQFNENSASTTRTNLSLGLPALTNTSNVTTMRALSGSTNTNHPYSGTFNLVDENANAFAVVVSNGIILSVTEY